MFTFSATYAIIKPSKGTLLEQRPLASQLLFKELVNRSDYPEFQGLAPVFSLHRITSFQQD